jgi:hypothetical protein
MFQILLELLNIIVKIYELLQVITVKRQEDSWLCMCAVVCVSVIVLFYLVAVIILDL